MEVIETVLTIQNVTIGKCIIAIDKLKKEFNTEKEDEKTLEKITTLYKMKKQAEEIKKQIEKQKEELNKNENDIQK